MSGKSSDTDREDDTRRSETLLAPYHQHDGFGEKGSDKCIRVEKLRVLSVHCQGL